MKVTGLGRPRLPHRPLPRTRDPRPRSRTPRTPSAPRRQPSATAPTSTVSTAEPPRRSRPQPTHLLDQLADPERHEGDRVVITVLTWLLGTEIVLATITAVDYFRDLVHNFVDEVDSEPRVLREALAAASAWCETLMGYEHAETFGVED
jgi:hypothetical protein